MSAFRDDALRGLAARPKTLPGKYLWDARGSEIFERITELPAYYATATEMRLLRSRIVEIAALVGRQATIVEFGSGATQKVAVLLDTLREPARYVGIDISAEFTAAAAARLRRDYPAVEVVFVHADYSQELPSLPIDRERPVLGFLPGSTIGNMPPDEAAALLARIRRGLGDADLLIGQDPNHDAARLQAAYGNAQMAAFHENILLSLQREVAAEVIPDDFRHEARILDAPRRVEAHLVAVRPTTIKIDERAFPIAAGESIRTDLSWKYDPDAFSALAASAGWMSLQRWSAPDALFCLHLLRSS